MSRVYPLLARRMDGVSHALNVRADLSGPTKGFGPAPKGCLRPLCRVHQPVARAGLGQDVAGPRGICLEFPPEL